MGVMEAAASHEDMGSPACVRRWSNAGNTHDRAGTYDSLELFGIACTVDLHIDSSLNRDAGDISFTFISDQ
jgi:hypothetical protein